MDYGTIGSIVTVVVLVSFIGVVLWAFSSRSKAGFEEAANLVFADEPKEQESKNKRESSVNE